MRAIKFRAWQKHEKRMAQVTNIVLGFEKKDIVRLTGDTHEWASHWIGEDAELMQFTGLKDKNGKEIYEGDVLKIEDATAKVVFWERPPEFGLDFYHNEDKWCEDWNLTDDSERMEVIGNTYEDPELLDISQAL